MLFFSTFCLFYRFTVLPVFFFGGEVAWFVWFVWSGLFGSFLFPSLFVSLFACWAMNSRNPSIVKILQKHVLFETWNATHLYHANLMIHDDSDLTQNEIQGSGYNDVGRSFKATAGFNRNDKAPGVGSWNPKDTNHRNCFMLHQTSFVCFDSFKLLKPPQQKHTPNRPGSVPWRSWSTKCCGWRSRTWGEFQRTGNPPRVHPGTFWWWKTSTRFFAKQHF